MTHRPGTQNKGGEGVRRESCFGQLRRRGEGRGGGGGGGVGGWGGGGGGGGERGRKTEQRLQGVTCFIDVCPLFCGR